MSSRFKTIPVIDCNGTELKEGQIISYPGRRRSHMYMNIGRIAFIYPAVGYINVQRRMPGSKEFSEKYVLIRRTDRVSVLEQPTPQSIVGNYQYGYLTFPSSNALFVAQQKLDMEKKEYQAAVKQWKKEQAEVKRLSGRSPLLCTCKLQDQKNNELIWGGLPYAHQTL